MTILDTISQTYCLGFWDDGPPPKGGFVCTRCQERTENPKLESSWMHIKALKKHGGGFHKTWVLRCPVLGCIGHMRLLSAVSEPLQLDLI